jgi:hypothetical protein
MATNYGTLSVSDLLAATGQSIADFGEDNAFGALQAGLDAHNAIVRNMLMSLCVVTAERLTRYGGDTSMEMVDLDEYGQADSQKVATGSNVGFPLRLSGVTLGWTRKWFQNHTPAELAAQYTAARDADVRRIRRDIARAFFTATNNTSYIDRLTDNAVLPIRALLNGDGASIPYGPNGETFDGSTHTHYLGTGSMTASNVSALIQTVLEHGATNGIQLWINQAQEAAIRGFTSNFTAYVDPRIRPASTATVADGALDMSNPYDRAIGVFDAAEVHVKPWIPANYLLATDPTSPQKPLAIRTRTGTLDGPGALQIVADNEQYPLRAQSMEREYGIAALNRWNGAALYISNATYANPSIS